MLLVAQGWEQGGQEGLWSTIARDSGAEAMLCVAVPVFALCSHPEAHPICITATSVYRC